MERWVVEISARAPRSGTRALGGLLATLQDFEPVVEARRGVVEASPSLHAPDAGAAAVVGVDAFRRACAEAGLRASEMLSVRVTREAEFEREIEDGSGGAGDPPAALCGVTEAARLLGVSRQRVAQLAARHPLFPRPVARLGGR
ncbi:MAG: hypothetical protein HY775_06240 [Acidobacteria bacterium]|nr:hypothetical protein [Acidobacteriota bacterium]